MKQIALLTPTLESEDAVGNDILGMHEILSSYGHDVRVFAESWSVPRSFVSHISKIRNFLKKDSSVLIYHHSFGWNIGFDILSRLNCRKIIRYHNVTPPEFFMKYNEPLADACRFGRDQLQSIADLGCDLYLACSEYSLGELIERGVDKSSAAVVPPFHHISRLFSIHADLSVIDKYNDDTVNILMVGRIVPNKGHKLLIEAFATYYHIYNKKARLLIVGKIDEGFWNYLEELYLQIEARQISEAVTFTGGVSDEALKAYYLISDVFMITSEHEGFCVPIVEAMAMNLPVVAYGTSAVTETAGEVEIVWDNPDPYLFAGSIEYLVKNETAKNALGIMGWQRYNDIFDNAVIKYTFMKSLKGIL